MRRVVIAMLVPLAACASLDERLAQVCRARGLENGTAEMARCIEDERSIYEARVARSRAAVRFAPPWSATRPPATCYPSPNTGVTCGPASRVP